jgi:FeS assembly SUF system regulator
LNESMLRLSKLADYGVVIMTAAARAGRGGAASCAGLPLSAAQVAALTGLPVPTVAKLAGQLARAGLLASQRGVAGGFALSRPAAAISLADIVEAIDGPIVLTHCGSDHQGCDLALRCAVRPHWAPVSRAVRQALAAVSLAELTPEIAPHMAPETIGVPA